MAWPLPVTVTPDRAVNTPPWTTRSQVRFTLPARVASPVTVPHTFPVSVCPAGAVVVVVDGGTVVVVVLVVVVVVVVAGGNVVVVVDGGTVVVVVEVVVVPPSRAATRSSNAATRSSTDCTHADRSATHPGLAATTAGTNSNTKTNTATLLRRFTIPPLQVRYLPIVRRVRRRVIPRCGSDRITCSSDRSVNVHTVTTIGSSCLVSATAARRAITFYAAGYTA
jgi:hypothetical protein